MKALLKIDENKKQNSFFSNNNSLSLFYNYFPSSSRSRNLSKCRFSCPLLSLLFTSTMKTHTIGFLVAVLVFAALFSESDCFDGPFRTKN